MRRWPGLAIGVAPVNGRPEACASRWRTVEPSGPAASSRSITPSSAATSVANAAAGLVSEAHRSSTSRGPRDAARSPFRRTATAATLAPQPSICRSASTAGDTRRVTRRIVPAVSPFAETVGYSRALREGRHVYVAGTAAIYPDGVETPTGAYAQAKRCLEIIVAALAEVGATAADVVRTRVYLVRAEDWGEVGRAPGAT